MIMYAPLIEMCGCHAVPVVDSLRQRSIVWRTSNGEARNIFLWVSWVNQWFKFHQTTNLGHW